VIAWPPGRVPHTTNRHFPPRAARGKASSQASALPRNPPQPRLPTP
jgi:hypothetical protein